jgi:CHAD domain-containing protein
MEPPASEGAISSGAAGPPGGPPPAVSSPPPVEAMHKARPVKLLRQDSAEDAAVSVFSAALDHFEENLPHFKARQSAESVHQMRVGLRRLRAAIGLFRGAVFGQRLEAARAGAKSLASILGAARDWDVFREMLDDGPGRTLADDPSFQALLDAVESRRTGAYRAAKKALESAKTKKFIGDFRKAIAARDWTPEPGARDPESARAYATQALTRLRKRVLKKSRGLAQFTPDERHEVRIALKKARYGAEFFESLFSHRAEAAAFSAALARIQDGLGVFNDMETVNRLLDEIDAGDDGKALRASGFVRGWFAHAAREGDAHARKSEKRLKRLEPFWG